MSEAILVLGAGGFIGRALTRALAMRGDQVIAVSRQPIDLGLKNVDYVVGEPGHVEDFLPLIEPCRTVVHAASRSTPGTSAGQPLAEVDGNLRPTIALLQALQNHPAVRLLYLSSGGSLYTTLPNEPAIETSPTLPRSYHGAGKVAAEYFIGAWCHQYHGNASILRPSNIYGPGQFERAGFGIIPTTLGKIIRGEVLHVWGDGSVVRDYLHISDFVSLCLATLDDASSSGMQIFNASSGTGFSLNQLFEIMETVTGMPVHRTYDASRAVDSLRVVMDAGHANRRYGWTATTTLEEGIADTWAWFKSFQQ